jgi:hypothetical protein
MKVFAFTLALAGVTTAASLNAQVRPGTVISGSSRTQRGTDCSYNRTSNTIGDIIFGRTNFNTNCRDVYSREDGAWYQVGNGRSQIYERRVRDNYGYLIIQRARRNPNGTFTILNTRLANDNDKEWRKEQKRWEKERRKAQKRNGDYGNYGYHRDRDHDDDDYRYSDANYRYDQFGNRIYIGPTANTNRDYGYKGSKQKDHGRGKGKKDRD